MLFGCVAHITSRLTLTRSEIVDMDAIEQDLSVAQTVSYKGERVCKTCGVNKHITEFVISRTGRHKGGRKSVCKSCQRARNNENKALRAEIMAEKFHRDHTEILHFGVDEKYGDVWRELDAALSMCQRTTPLQKAA